MSKRFKSKKPEDELTFSPCFKVDASVQLKDVPSTGEEYLLKVITERKNCRAVTKCNEDLSKFEANQSRFAVEPPMLRSAPEALKPTIEWQNLQIAEFSRIRTYISQMQNRKSRWPSSVEKIDIVTEDVHIWKQFFYSKTPLLSCLFGMSDHQLEIALKILVYHIINQTAAGETVDSDIGRWIYAILACLKLPLLSNVCSMLRDLARTCAEIRSKIPVDNEDAKLSATPLNLFICFVSRYFKQVDLAE